MDILYWLKGGFNIDAMSVVMQVHNLVDHSHQGVFHAFELQRFINPEIGREIHRHLWQHILPWK